MAKKSKQSRPEVRSMLKQAEMQKELKFMACAVQLILTRCSQ